MLITHGWMPMLPGGCTTHSIALVQVLPLPLPPDNTRKVAGLCQNAIFGAEPLASIWMRRR